MKFSIIREESVKPVVLIGKRERGTLPQTQECFFKLFRRDRAAPAVLIQRPFCTSRKLYFVHGLFFLAKKIFHYLINRVISLGILFCPRDFANHFLFLPRSITIVTAYNKWKAFIFNNLINIQLKTARHVEPHVLKHFFPFVFVLLFLSSRLCELV